MRLGGPVLGTWTSPQEWAALVRRAGYSAAPWPLTETVDSATIAAYAHAAAAADVVIAEVGAWSNPLSPDEMTRRTALTLCQERLALADALGARCCVNIAGSRGPQWDGPHPANLTPDTFALIVDSVRTILDAVRPTRTYYALEAMPWIYPDSVASYRRLLRAIDRPRFAVHLDPVNLVCSPQRYYTNAALIRACFAQLGPHIRSCHAKDIRLGDTLTVHLEEVRPGLGGLDYTVYLTALERLDPEMPLLLEHLESAEEYGLAAGHLRALAGRLGVALR